MAQNGAQNNGHDMDDCHEGNKQRWGDNIRVTKMHQKYCTLKIWRQKTLLGVGGWLDWGQAML